MVTLCFLRGACFSNIDVRVLPYSTVSSVTSLIFNLRIFFRNDSLTF